jgi:hypothetical protein
LRSNCGRIAVERGRHGAVCSRFAPKENKEEKSRL